MWANVHISYWMGLAIQFIYWIGDWPSSRTPVAFLLERLGLRGWRAPAAILGASAAVSFVNPWGWRALWQPFEYYLYWRHEPIFKTIGELVPLDWSFNQRNLLPALLAVAVALPLWRAWRREFDRVEWLMLGLFMPLAIATQRFLGFLAVMMAMFLGRDLDEFARSRGWRPSTAGTTPAEKRVESDVAWPWARALSIALLCVVVSVPEWTRTSMPLGVAIDWRSVPVRACDFVAEHGVRGRGMNQFAEGGYQVYRFWPDRSRLPFMDIHQAGTREDRLLYAYAQQDSAAWRMLDNKYRFDYVLLFTHQYPNDHLIDRLGADSTHWALAFSDDAGSLFLRRDGPFAELANQYRYQVLPAGNQDLIPSLNAAVEDSSKRRRLEGEFERSARASSLNSRAKIALAFLADAEGREVAARQILNEVIHDDPFAVHAHEYRAEIELGAGEARAAIADLEREARIQIESAGLNVKLGRAWQAAGDGTRARDRYRRALRLEPGNQAARDSLARLERAAAR
jgi:Tfp pilus assembly protein PilF